MDESQKKNYVYNIKLLKIEPYIPIIKKHFGLFVSDLEPELFLAKEDPERTYQIPENVAYDDIRKAFVQYFGDGVESETEVLNLLWLVANFYYGDFYKQRQQQWIDDVGQERYIWPYIREDIIKLYKLTQESQVSNVPIKVTIGGNTIEIRNDYQWFNCFLTHRLFPHCIPEINSVEDAKAELDHQNKGGRPKSDPVIKGIVYGVATYFHEKGIVTGKAPKNLVRFIMELLIMMDLLSDPTAKQVIGENWIKSRIHQLDEPQLDNLDFENCKLEDLKPSQQEIAFQWLFPPMSHS